MGLVSKNVPIAVIARTGYVARGIVFLAIGVFALLAAMGSGSRPLGARDALQRLFERPLGGFLVWTVAVGLFCFAAWRLVQSIFDADQHGRTVYGLARRTIFAFSGLFYAAFAVATARITLSVQSGSENQSARDWTGWLMSMPLGRLMIALIGLGFMTVTIGLAVKVVRAPYRRRIDTRLRTREWVVALGSFGILTRAVVFLMVGGFLEYAAYESDSTAVVGLSGALHTIQQQAYGGPLLALAALGLLAFAGFEFIEASFRRIRPPSLT